MAEKKGNRKRWVQVKLCLTPEEKSVLDHDVRNSGLSQSEYLLQTLINKIDRSAISCERKYSNSCLDISFKIGKQRIGYASCLYFESTNTVQVSGFYVIKQFQDLGIEEKLLQEIAEYADINGAEKIVAYPGPEPYCPTEWKPLDVQTAWYKAQGFHLDHLVNNIIPCMIKPLCMESVI